MDIISAINSNSNSFYNAATSTTAGSNASTTTNLPVASSNNNTSHTITASSTGMDITTTTGMPYGTINFNNFGLNYSNMNIVPAAPLSSAVGGTDNSGNYYMNSMTRTMSDPTAASNNNNNAVATIQNSQNMLNEREFDPEELQAFEDAEDDRYADVLGISPRRKKSFSFDTTVGKHGAAGMVGPGGGQINPVIGYQSVPSSRITASNSSNDLSVQIPMNAINTGPGSISNTVNPGSQPASLVNVQRRKRRKCMEVTELLPDGTTITRRIVAPKGIYKTPHGYRVQLNIEPSAAGGSPSDAGDVSTPGLGGGSLASKRGKFSRNSKTFEDAVWVYEIAILISDAPATVQDMLLCGNYESMQSMNWFNTCEAYLFNLNRSMIELSSRKVLTDVEFALGKQAYEKIAIAYYNSQNGNPLSYLRQGANNTSAATNVSAGGGGSGSGSSAGNGGNAVVSGSGNAPVSGNLLGLGVYDGSLHHHRSFEYNMKDLDFDLSTS